MEDQELSRMIHELDMVALTTALPEHGLEAGDVGTVVMVHEDGAGYTIEFMTFAGETVAIATVDAATVRPIRDREIANVRLVA
jgi:Domain of unknown function (DUF4926)